LKGLDENYSFRMKEELILTSVNNRKKNRTGGHVSSKILEQISKEKCTHQTAEELESFSQEEQGKSSKEDKDPV